ncbi:MAG TPA: TonB-dependent receptor [Bryobacteraceae bacterium]|nr:TonB-dependent receptor [Bryobacteraceae bacterium]
MKNLLIAGVACAALCFCQSGVVKSEGQPIPGATVKATQGDRILLTLTDETGAFHFDGLTPGMWIVEVDMFGFDHARKEAQIPNRIDFTLQLRDRSRFANRGQAAEANAETSMAEGLLNAASAEPPPTPQASAEASNESLLVNGSLSQGVQTTANDIRDFQIFGPGGMGGMGPGGMGPGGMGQGGMGPDGAGGPPGLAAGRGPGGGGGFGPGGFGGGGGGFGGGGGGFGGGRGGGGGGGGRGGRGMPRDRNGNAAFIGNRNPNNNRITGSLFYTLGNSALNGRPFAVNGIPEPKASYSQNRFGISAGGPLAIPKLFNWSKVFWFVNYTGNLQRNGIDTALSEPTAQQRVGDFSQTSSIIYDPLSGAPFPNNQIPAYRISSIAQGLSAYLPLPNQAVSGINQNYRLIAANPNNAQNLNVRLNTTITQKDTLALTFNLQKRDTDTFQTFGCCDTLHGQGLNTNFNWRHRFAARSFNNLTLLFNRNTNTTTPFFANGTNVAADLGILGTSPSPLNYGPPSLSFTNFSSLSDTNDSRTAVWSYGFNDTLQLRRGKHNWSFGGGITHFLNNSITDQNGRGSFSFSGLSTAGYANGLPISNTGYDYADFLLGLPETTSIRYGDSSLYFRSNGFNAFAMDDYRVATGLTLNLGLRYEYFTPWHEEYGHIANLEIGPNFSSVTPVCAVTVGTCNPLGYPPSLIKGDRNNFGPRLAVAWKPWPRGKLLIRAGYGWYYNPSQYNQFMQRLGAQPPFATVNSATTVLGNPLQQLTLASGLLNTSGKSVTNTYAVALDYHNSYAQTWNVLLQRDLPHRWVGELSYMGTKGTRLDVQEAPNQAPLGSSLTAYQRLPIADAGNFTFDDPVGDSIYHAMQVRITRRFQRGISTNFFYTFSKAIDDVALAQDFYDQAAERALSATDHRHAITANWVLASPVDATRGFLSHPEFLAKALKDWTLSGSLTAQTGAPLTATISGDRDGTASLAPLRANATGAPIDSGSGYFNLAAFSVPLAGTYGSAGRDTITGPGNFVMNFSLARSINLHSERRRLEIRFDSTNTFNHVNPSGLVTIVNSAQYGLITSAGQMRQLTATVRLRF